MSCKHDGDAVACTMDGHGHEHADPGHGHHSHGHHDSTPAAVASPHASHAAHGGHGGGSLASLTTAATLHCLVGCAIGEFAGLALGVSLGLGVWPTIALATALGFASGFAFSLVPLTRSGMSLGAAWRAIWLGETLSIAAMELAMNVADYHLGGMGVSSLTDPVFYTGFGGAMVAGFAVAWPVNFWMLGRAIKKPCH